MSAAVPAVPQVFPLRALVTSRPISANHGRTFNDNLLFLLCRNLPIVTSQVFPGAPKTNSKPYHIAYTRTPGCWAIYIEIEFNIDVVDTVSLTISGSSGSLDRLPPLSTGPYTPFTYPVNTDVNLDYPVVSGIYDVTDMPIGTTDDITITPVATSHKVSVYRISITEIPLANTFPDNDPTNERGLSAAWTSVSNPLVDGSASTAYGFDRLLSELGKARKEVRRQWEICCREDTTGDAWYTNSSSFGQINWQSIGGGDPTWIVRARRVYTSATANKYIVQVRYLSAGGNGTLRVIVTPKGGSPANTDITLSTSATWNSLTGAVTLPTNGTDQECEISYQAKVAGGGTLYLGQIAWTENED